MDGGREGCGGVEASLTAGSTAALEMKSLV